MPRPPRSTTARGYDAKHKAERKRLEPIVARGEAVCARCRKPIAAGAAWDLGHNDARTAWTGPEHVYCNRSAAARKRNGTEPVPWTRPERDW